MCDYSMEHLTSIKAQVGEVYKLVGGITHGFVTMDSDRFINGRLRNVTAVCCTHGQRLRLSQILVHHNVLHMGLWPTEAIVTMVQRDHDKHRLAHHLGAYNDGLEFDDGRIIPIAYLVSCVMELLPVEAPKVAKPNLAKLLGLPADRELVRVERELVEGDD